MADNPTKQARDRKRIDVSQSYECRYWSEKLGVTPEQLKKAVSRVGPMVKDVQRELNSPRTISVKSARAAVERVSPQAAVGLLLASIGLGLGILWIGGRLRERLH